MITYQQYLEALSHPDPYVRNGVLAIFRNDYNLGSEFTAAVLASMDKFGIDAAFQCPSEIPCFSLDEASVHSLLEKVSTWGETSEAYNFLSWAAEKAQTTILDKILPEIESLTNGSFKNLPPVTLKIKQRIAIRNIPADECLSHLEAVLEECARKDDYSHDLMEKAERICERMVEAGDSLPELEKLTMEWLSFDFNQDFCERHWHSHIGIILAGLLGLKSAIPRLIEHYQLDSDFWNESIQKSLCQLRSKETMGLCAEIYPTLDWSGRLYTKRIFLSRSIPGLEPLLFRLLENEPDPDLQLDLGIALAIHGTPEALRKAKKLYMAFEDCGEAANIAEVLYAQYAIAGINDSDIISWKERDERMPSRIGDNYFNQEHISPNHAPSKPIRNPIKIGRNDPCPCGSGKKYKKCCG